MKTFNVFVSMLAFVLMSNLSSANNPNDELGTTGPTPTIIKHPVPYQDAGADWPKTKNDGNIRLWKTYWDTKENIFEAFSIGRNNLYEAFSLNNKTPIKTRSLDILAASARFTVVPALLTILSAITYHYTDEDGQPTDTVTVMQHQGPWYDTTTRIKDGINNFFGFLNRF